MKPKPVVPRDVADRDAAAAIAFYQRDGAPGVALAFVDALERAYGHIGRHPGAGSPRYAHGLNLPGLRVWPVRGYPYLVFYTEGPSCIDVWRVLHGERDIPAWLNEAPG